MPQTPLPVILISGFLGAGKTTLVRHLLTSAKEQSIKVALVVNEFGDVDVDSYLLENYGAEFIASIAGGCACCGGQDDLMETLEEISTRPQNERPDVVLIEASGAADPLALIDVITSPSLLTSVRLAAMVAVADSTRLDDLHGVMGPILQSQLQLAEPIILNKLDLLSGDPQPAIASIKSFHPDAQILPASQGKIDAQVFWQNALASSKVLSTEGHAHFHFACQSVLCPLPHPVSKEKLEAALNQLPTEVLRVKGFVRLRGESALHLLQYTASGNYRDYHFAPFYMTPGATEPLCALVVLGSGLDEDALQKYLSPFALGSDW
ncbi:MAG: GTP-binding protein [Abditibacteriaceae bacterium]